MPIPEITEANWNAVLTPEFHAWMRRVWSCEAEECDWNTTALCCAWVLSGHAPWTFPESGSADEAALDVFCILHQAEIAACVDGLLECGEDENDITVN